MKVAPVLDDLQDKITVGTVRELLIMTTIRAEIRGHCPILKQSVSLRWQRDPNGIILIPEARDSEIGGYHEGPTSFRY